MVRRPDPDLRLDAPPETGRENGQLTLQLDLAPQGNSKLPDGYEWYTLVTDLDFGAAIVAVVANWWNVFTRLGEDGSHREATTSRPLLQRCVASIGTHAREKVVTLYVCGKDRTREVFKGIAGFLGGGASASQVKPEARWMVIVRYAFRLLSLEKHEFPPWIDDQYMLNL